MSRGASIRDGFGGCLIADSSSAVTRSAAICLSKRAQQERRPYGSPCGGRGCIIDKAVTALWEPHQDHSRRAEEMVGNDGRGSSFLVLSASSTCIQGRSAVLRPPLSRHPAATPVQHLPIAADILEKWVEILQDSVPATERPQEQTVVGAAQLKCGRRSFDSNFSPFPGRSWRDWPWYRWSHFIVVGENWQRV